MKDKIIEEFTKSNLNIINVDKLNEYIDFCLENRVPYKKFETNNHHILPKAKSLPFTKFIDSEWNLVNLTLLDHLKAHSILNEAIEHFAIINSLSLLEKINKTQTKETLKRRAKLQSEYMNEEVEIEGIVQSRGKHRGKNISKGIKNSEKTKRGSEKRKKLVNSDEWKNTVGKECNRKHSETINSKEWKETTGKIQKRKRKKSMNKKVNSKTILENSGIKQSKTKSSEEWKNTVEKERVKKYQKTMDKKNSYLLINVFTKEEQVKTKKEIRTLSPSLFRTSETKYLGWSKTSESRLISNNNTHLRGLYIKELFTTK